MKMFNYVDICEANSPFQALGCFHLILTHPMQTLSPGASVLSKLSFLLYNLLLILPTNGTQHLVSQYIVSGWSLWPIRLAHIVSHQVWVGADMWTILRLILEAICKEDFFFLRWKLIDHLSTSFLKLLWRHGASIALGQIHREEEARDAKNTVWAPGLDCRICGLLFNLAHHALSSSSKQGFSLEILMVR